MNKFGIDDALPPKFGEDCSSYGVGGPVGRTVFEIRSNEELAEAAGITVKQLEEQIKKSKSAWVTDPVVTPEGRCVGYTYYADGAEAQRIADWLNSLGGKNDRAV